MKKTFTMIKSNIISVKILNMSKVIECSSDYEYQGAIGNSGDSLMLVEFYSNWSTPSQVVSQDLESLRIEYPDLIHVRINFDSCPVRDI